MAKFQFVKGETSVILPVFIQDSSATTGAGLGSLDETSLITGGYVKRGGVGVALAVDENVTTEGTYEAPTTAGQVRIGTIANMPTGFYELHFHNDLFTTADYVTVGLGGATNMAPMNLEVQLTTIDLNTALASSTIGTCTTNTDMVGTANALLASSAPTNFGDMAIEASTGIVSSDMVEINSVAASAAKLEQGAFALVTGAAITGTLSTTQMTTNLLEATDDHYNGRVITWTSGALEGQATNITDYTGSSKLLTFTATTEAPANTDTFVIS